MTIPELIKATQEEIDLSEQIMQTLIRDVKDYPKNKCRPSQITRLEHMYNTLQTLNNLLTEPVY
jgi:hypothetical protein